MSELRYKWFGKEDLSELERALKEKEIPVEQRFQSELDLRREETTTELDHLIAESGNLTVRYYPKEAWLSAEGELTEKDRKNLRVAKERYPYSRSRFILGVYGWLAVVGMGLVVTEYLSQIGL